MKTYSLEEQREIWNKQKMKGKKRFVAKMTVSFILLELFIAIIGYLFSNYLFELPNYSMIKITLILILIIIMSGAYGIKQSYRLWDKRAIKFEGLSSIATEINDNELKDLILKNEKIMAAKRYRSITGVGIKESMRYVDLISEYYSYKESNCKNE